MICCDRCKDKIPATRRTLACGEPISAKDNITSPAITGFDVTLCTKCTDGLHETVALYIRQENPT